MTPHRVLVCAVALLLAVTTVRGQVPTVTSHPEAQKLMVEGESLFAEKKFEEALARYQGALELVPGLYEAALFSGDMYLQLNDLDQAMTWYEKAIAINPARETAHRYSATPLMQQKRYDEARERYIEAYLLEPYNPGARNGLSQWARITTTPIAHPAIVVPVKVTLDPNGASTVSMDPRALQPEGVADGTSLWVGYGSSRVAWFKSEFLRRFPEERVYRHSLAEESEILGMLVRIAAKSPNVTELSPSLQKLTTLYEEGLLEAYVLLARPDQGIAVDYPAYLREHRDLLLRYVTEYLLKGGGN